jgi:hypothetical protein
VSAVYEALEYRDELLNAARTLEHRVDELEELGDRLSDPLADEFDTKLSNLRHALEDAEGAIPCHGGLVDFVEGLEAGAAELEEQGPLFEALARELEWRGLHEFAYALRVLASGPDDTGHPEQVLGQLVLGGAA